MMSSKEMWLLLVTLRWILRLTQRMEFVWISSRASDELCAVLLVLHTLISSLNHGIIHLIIVSSSLSKTDALV